LPSADAETTEEAVVEVDEARQALLEAITGELGDVVVAHHLIPNRDAWIRVTPEAWADTATYLRDRQRFRFFDWLSAIDWMPSPFGRSLDAAVSAQADADADGESDEAASGDAEAEEVAKVAGGDTRFQVFARVYNLATHLGITIKADVGEEMTVPSWIDIYPGAAWHEREAHEMFGITFAGNPDMRNLYLPGDFVGHPLRKDFPLMARLVKPWPGIVDVEPMPEVESPSAENPEAGA
jgi:NADH-quinone oxidoreductase subunit C